MTLIGIVVIGMGALLVYAAVTNHSVPCLIQNALSGSSNDCTMTSGASSNAGGATGNGLDATGTPIYLGYNVNGSFAKLLTFAQSQLGKPYVYGSTSAAIGYDCSLFTQTVYNQIGINIGRTTADQLQSGTTVGTDGASNWNKDIALLKPGDLIFYGQPGATGPDAHVVMYIGGGQVAQAGGSNVNISNIFQSASANEPFLGVRRYANLS